jgi:hypothetical protein
MAQAQDRAVQETAIPTSGMRQVGLMNLKVIKLIYKMAE